MTTTALQRAERTPHDDRRVQERNDSVRRETETDFKEFLRSSETQPGGKRAASHANGQSEGSDSMEAPTGQTSSSGVAESSAVMALILAWQMPVTVSVETATKSPSADAAEGDASGAGSDPGSLADATEASASQGGSPIGEQSGVTESTATTGKKSLSEKQNLPGSRATKKLAKDSESESMVRTKRFKESATDGAVALNSTFGVEASSPGTNDASVPSGGDGGDSVPADGNEALVNTSASPPPLVGVETTHAQILGHQGAVRPMVGPMEGKSLPNPADESPGTPAATTTSTMQFAPSQNGFAGGAKQDLPGRKERSTESKVSAADTAFVPVVSGLANGAHLTAEAPPMLAAPSLAEHVTQRIEKIGELLHSECMLMRQVKPASLSAVLRPDAQTEIHIQLRFDRNGIEAVCRCEKGDLPSLQTGWSKLQSQLSQQGVRLMPIQGSTEPVPSSGGWLTGQGDRENPRREPRERDLLPVFWGLPAVTNATLTSRTGQDSTATVTVVSRHMLESWA